jgi:CRP/FNR family transcriptional regulator, polysaccharide utilization system transcription regulator
VIFITFEAILVKNAIFATPLTSMAEKNIIRNCELCTRGWKNFSTLNSEQLERVNRNRYEANFRAGEIIIKQDSPALSALFISDGYAKVYIEDDSGKNFILSIAKPGGLLVGPGVFVNFRYTYTVAALTPVNACFINFEVFRELIRENALFAEGMLTDISIKSLKMHNRLVCLAHKKMPGRLASAFIIFADEVFMADEFDMILSRKELGEMTNMAKECVVRILKDFEERGVIETASSRIKILDKEKLLHISISG